MRTYNSRMTVLLAEKDRAVRLERERPCDVCGVTTLFPLCGACYRNHKANARSASASTSASASASPSSSVSPTTGTTSPAAMDMSEEEASVASVSSKGKGAYVSKTTKNDKACEDCSKACRGRWCDDCWTRWKDEQRQEREQRRKAAEQKRADDEAKAKTMKPTKCNGHNCPKMTTRYFCLECHRINQRYVL